MTAAELRAEARRLYRLLPSTEDAVERNLLLRQISVLWLAAEKLAQAEDFSRKPTDPMD